MDRSCRSDDPGDKSRKLLNLVVVIFLRDGRVVWGFVPGLGVGVGQGNGL